MGVILESLECPSCGGIVKRGDSECPYCGRSLILLIAEPVSDNNHYGQNKSLEFYLKKAANCLHGKRPFLCKREDVNQCILVLEESSTIFNDAVLDYFRAFVEYDYFERKNLNRNPGYLFFYKRSEEKGVLHEDVSLLEDILNVKIMIGR